jgi:hypothetical protein
MSTSLEFVRASHTKDRPHGTKAAFLVDKLALTQFLRNSCQGGKKGQIDVTGYDHWKYKVRKMSTFTLAI